MGLYTQIQADGLQIAYLSPGVMPFLTVTSLRATSIRLGGNQMQTVNLSIPRHGGVQE